MIETRVRISILILPVILTVWGVAASFGQDGQEVTYVDLTVVTYNIHHGDGMDGLYSVERIARTLAQYSPHLIALQEVDMGTHRTEEDMQAEIIARRLGMYYAFGKNIDFMGGEYGNAILSVYPIKSWQNSDISHVAGMEDRGLLRATIDTGVRKIRFYSTHFGLKEMEQDYQSNRVAQILRGLQPAEPVILGGDLNVEPYNSLLTPLMKQLIDLGSRLNNPMGTYPTGMMTRRIDYILANRFIEPLEYRVAVDTLSIVASDHLPVVAKVRVSLY